MNNTNKNLIHQDTEEKLFDEVMIPVLEEAFDGACVLATPWNEISSFNYDGTLDEDFDSFDRNLELFQKFYNLFKEEILPKVKDDNVAIDVDMVCEQFMANALKNQIFDDQSSSATTKYNLKVFEINDELLAKIMDGISAFNIQTSRNS